MGAKQHTHELRRTKQKTDTDYRREYLKRIQKREERDR